jgi:CRP-like cAMP-binding protein
LTGQTLKQLAQVPICRGLSEAEVSQVFELAQELTAAQGEVLFREGDRGDSLFVLLEGQAEVLKQDKAGQPRSLATLGQGSVVGEMSLLSSAPRSATVRAATAVRLLRIDEPSFTGLLKTDSLGALKMVANLALVMSRRLSLMDEKLVDLLDKGQRKDELVDFQRILNNWSF